MGVEPQGICIDHLTTAEMNVFFSFSPVGVEGNLSLPKYYMSFSMSLQQIEVIGALFR